MPVELPIALTPRTAPASHDLAGYRIRRRVVGFAKRTLRWEFWPPYVFYPPVIAYLVWLGARFRSFTLFTAANPAIPAGGFVGESKHSILENLKEATGHLPAWTLLPLEEAGARLRRAMEFLEASGLEYPVVVKPDGGQRGSGVGVVRSAEHLKDHLKGVAYPVILQEYVPGKEFGVFYFRDLEEDCGHIFSVTEKRMPEMVGDGRRTLEELILADDRAVCMAEFYLRKNSHRAHQIPAEGERVPLVELGTHCRGAIFLDANQAVTPALEQSIDRIAKSFDGFYFGRFDIRVPSDEDFRAGRNLKVIELNGVTSEATHIYDPGLSLLEAYRVLFRQWRIAFEIGEKNRRRGYRPATVLELLRMIREYRRLARTHPA